MKKWISVLLALVMIAVLWVPALASEKPSEKPSEEPSGEPSEDPFAPLEFPDDAKIVSATVYTYYTKSEKSPQDAVLKVTLYWDMTNDEVYEIRFMQPLLPKDDNGVASGWSMVTDEELHKTLADADALVEIQEGAEFAKYLQIGGIVWTGEPASHPAIEVSLDYIAEIDGEEIALNDYIRTPEGGEWYVNAAEEDVYFLTDDTPAESEKDDNVAFVYQIPYKETNGHGVFFWMSDITFPGNMQAIKDFVTENGFDYDYYADGGITKNEDGFWQTPDAVSGATLDETPSYLDALKTAYEAIQAGDYVEEN